MPLQLSAATRTAVHRVAQSPRTFSNWAPLLVQIAASRFGRGPDTLRFRTRSGATIECPNRPGARVPVYEIFAEDVYRLNAFLGPLMRRPIQVLDIGGHIGTFATRLARENPQATLTCYEPSPTTAGYLRRNVELNGLGGRVTVVEGALSSASGNADFDDNGAGSGLNGLVSANHHSGHVVEVRTVSFDDAVAGLGDGPDVVKIDCEGGEYDLVLGSSPQSWAGVQRVVAEYHPVPGHDWSELRDFFATAGLTVQAAETSNGYGCVWLSREPVDLNLV